jgi:hypothetical protein
VGLVVQVVHAGLRKLFQRAGFVSHRVGSVLARGRIDFVGASTQLLAAGAVFFGADGFTEIRDIGRQPTEINLLPVVERFTAGRSTSR